MKLSTLILYCLILISCADTSNTAKSNYGYIHPEITPAGITFFDSTGKTDIPNGQWIDNQFFNVYHCMVDGKRTSKTTGVVFGFPIQLEILIVPELGTYAAGTYWNNHIEVEVNSSVITSTSTTLRHEFVHYFDDKVFGRMDWFHVSQNFILCS